MAVSFLIGSPSEQLKQPWNQCFVCHQRYLSRSALMRHKTKARVRGTEKSSMPILPLPGEPRWRCVARHIKTVHPTRYREVGLRDIVEVRSAEITSPAWSDARARPRVLDSPYSLKFPEGRVVDYPKYRQESPVTSKSVTPAMSRSLTSRRDLGRAAVSRSVTPGAASLANKCTQANSNPP